MNWKPIPNWPYEASELGEIRNSQTGRILKPQKGGHRYAKVDLHRPNGEFRREYVHRLVLLAHVGPCPEGCEAEHRDDVSSNNALSNLRWSTHASNIANRKHARGNQYTRRAIHGEFTPEAA